MNESDILKEIKKNIYNKTMENYNIYVLNKTQTNKEIYERLLKINKTVNGFKTLQEVSEYLTEIQKNLKELKVIFDTKVEEYNKDKKNEQVKNEVKNIMNVAQVLTDIYSDIKSKIARYKKTQKSNISAKFKEKKQEERQPEKTFQEQSKVQKYVDGVDFNNETVKEIENINKEILSLREKLVTLDVYSREALEIRKRVNELCEIREHIAYEVNGYDGVKFVKNIESLEIQYANTSKGEAKQEKEYDEVSFNKELMEKLMIIADLKFFGIESKYINVSPDASNKEKFEEYKKVYSKYMKEYICLIKSLYSNNPIIYKNADYVMHESDLRNLLEIYNLRGNYNDFKRKHKSGKIGNEAISKELYSEGLDRIEGLINSFKVLSSETIRQNGGKVKVSYDIETKETLKAEIDKNMAQFYKQICNKNNHLSM